MMKVSPWMCVACLFVASTGAIETTVVQAEGIFSPGTPGAGTQEYYQFHADSPVGSRQLFHKGKVWPPRPRPCGPHQPFCHKYHAATYWPWPYVCQDRAVVHSTINSQVENGWRATTTLYDFHFDDETNELNSAGRKQLHWILSHVPQQHQKLWVASSFDQGVTQARTMSVQTAMTNLGAGQQIPVELRIAHPLVRSAEVVETIGRAALDNTPAPVIQYQGISGGSGGGS